MTMYYGEPTSDLGDGLGPEYSIWTADASGRLSECLAKFSSDDGDGSDGAESVRQMAKAWAEVEGEVVLLQDGEYVGTFSREAGDIK